MNWWLKSTSNTVNQNQHQKHSSFFLTKSIKIQTFAEFISNTYFLCIINTFQKLEYSSELGINSPETFNFNPWLQTAFVKLIFVSPQVSNSTLESKHGWVLKSSVRLTLIRNTILLLLYWSVNCYLINITLCMKDGLSK